MFGKSLAIARLKRQIQDNASDQLRELQFKGYGDLLRSLVSESQLSKVSPRRFGAVSAYTPKQLSEFLRSVLKLPTDLAAVVSFQILPTHGSSVGLSPTIGGDFSMTLERTYLVAPDLGPKGAAVLARTVVLGTFFGLTRLMRKTVSNIGMTGMPGAESEFMVPEHRMAKEVVAEIEKLSPKLRRLFS